MRSPAHFAVLARSARAVLPLLAVGGLVVPLAGVTAASATGSAAAGPRLSLLAVQRTVTVAKVGKGPIFFDPDVWVMSAGSVLQIDVQRADYAQPFTVTQVIRTPSGGLERRSLPRWVLAGWQGLRGFLHLTITNSRHRVVASRQITFCPDSYNPDRAVPTSSPADPYPQQCSPFDPFPVGEVWGLPRGWAVDPFDSFAGPPLLLHHLALGRYRATVSIPRRYRRLFGIARAAATATVRLEVVNGDHCSPGGCYGTDDATAAVLHQLAGSRSAALAQDVPTLTRPPRTALPQLGALPSWGIRTSHASRRDWLDFGATVWVGGNAPLDVEGFHVPGSSRLAAYQYFWRDGKVIGRTRVGSMRYDNQQGHHHWHFEQFAQYRLLRADKRLAVRSRKVGFCIAPTDAVDMLLPHATWQPALVGLDGQCGSPGALWVKEYLPVGWGDTYGQFKAGQAFDITDLPNGVYYIEIIANPQHRLYELSSAGNVSLRKVIIGGTTGHRTVRVPAWHGVDPER
jgi:hypothetical protein